MTEPKPMTDDDNDQLDAAITKAGGNPSGIYVKREVAWQMLLDEREGAFKLFPPVVERPFTLTEEE